MNKIRAIISFVGLTTVCFGQVSDDFSDGDFTYNPTWSGSTAQFTINPSKQLQLSNSGAGQSYLSTSFATISLDNLEWQIYVKQNFSPSGTNYGRVYLASDQNDLTRPLNGYYLQFGEAQSNDAIELFRQWGNTSTSVCRGRDAGIAASFGVRIKVTRDNTGLWKLLVDYSGGTNFVLDASGTDITLVNSTSFGIRCTYTVTNAAKFFFDDISIMAQSSPPPPIDSTPPTVVSAFTVSNNSVSIEFSEPVDGYSSQIISNFSVNNSIGNPLSLVLQPDGKTLLLTFSASFSNGVQNQLSISGVQDLAGNEMAPVISDFMFFQAVPPNSKDIIITEIFPDPSPQVNLPEREYIEIYNRSLNPFDLSGWKLSDGTTTATFSSQVVLPGQYWIICSSASASVFEGYGKVLGVTNFPSLNNNSDNLTLRDTSNKTIDSTRYDLSWYHDTEKQDGGWSIEIIDLNNTCSEGENWIASEDPAGGTPGLQNSVKADKPDLTGPQLVSLSVQSSTRIRLTFNEKLEYDLSAAVLEITPAIPEQNRSFGDLSLREIIVEFTEPMESRTIYSLSVGHLHDCSGNSIQQDFSRSSFMLPEVADSLDVIVNEILFNPRTGGVDFIEIYNQSPKYIDLKNWRLGNYENSSFINSRVISSSNYFLRPAAYLVFTPDPSALTRQYSQALQNTLYKSTLPSLPDDTGTIALMSGENRIIDYFTYSEKMHSPFINDNEGVSLERIWFSESTNDPNNWKSANASAAFATPGFINSNTRPESFANEDAVTVNPEIFSPVAPGRDFSKINYKFDQSGKIANVRILDLEGRAIKTLANNETLAYEGFYRWDGDRDDGSRARPGYYVVWFEVFDSRGSVNIYRKRAVIAK